MALTWSDLDQHGSYLERPRPAWLLPGATSTSMALTWSDLDHRRDRNLYYLPLMICSSKELSCHAFFNVSHLRSGSPMLNSGNSNSLHLRSAWTELDLRTKPRLFKIYSIWPQAHTYICAYVCVTLEQCSLASVGLAQAHPNYQPKPKTH